MEPSGFREAQPAAWLEPPSARVIRKETDREIQATKTYPAPDTRYPAYGNTLEDGRQFTDYRPNCVTRAPPGQQFGVKQWTVHNSDKIIDITRQRQADAVGHVYGTADTEMPPAFTQKCSAFGCEFQVADPRGVGLERNEPVPDLFMTFDYSPGPGARKNVQKVGLNQELLMGRNTATRWDHLYQ